MKLKTTEEVNKNKTKANAPARKQAIETTKTVLIAVLITGIIAFVAGIQYQSNVNKDKNSAVSSALKTATVKN